MPPRLLRAVGFVTTLLLAEYTAVLAQHWLDNTERRTNRSIFRPLEDWPAPNDYRNASGSPGQSYWQQRVDYKIRRSLDTVHHVVTGSERITYHNNSPHQLRYLWIQLDQNIRSFEHSRRSAPQSVRCQSS